METYRIDFEKMDWTSPIPGVRHKLHTSGRTVLRLVEYSREMAPHWCDRGHVGYIVDGRFEIEFDRETRIYESGDGVFIPSGVEHRHKARVLTDVVRAVFVEDVR